MGSNSAQLEALCKPLFEPRSRAQIQPCIRAEIPAAPTPRARAAVSHARAAVSHATVRATAPVLAPRLNYDDTPEVGFGAVGLKCSVRRTGRSKKWHYQKLQPSSVETIFEEDWRTGDWPNYPEDQAHPATDEAQWSCASCTFLNAGASSHCQMCDRERGLLSATEEVQWSCASCTFVNFGALPRCKMCERPHRPPAHTELAHVEPAPTLSAQKWPSLQQSAGKCWDLCCEQSSMASWDFCEQSSIASSVVDVSKIAELEDDVHFDNLSAVSSWLDVGSPEDMEWPSEANSCVEVSTEHVVSEETNAVARQTSDAMQRELKTWLSVASGAVNYVNPSATNRPGEFIPPRVSHPKTPKFKKVLVADLDDEIFEDQDGRGYARRRNQCKWPYVQKNELAGIEGALKGGDRNKR